MNQQLKVPVLGQHIRWMYIVLGIILMMFLGTVYSYSVFRLSLENQFQIGSAESGTPYMTALAFYALFMFLTGKYIEKFNPKKIILVGGFLVSLGWILSSFATNITILTLTYGCISGAGVGIAYGVPMAVIAKWFPEKKGFAVGLVLIGFGLSPLVTAPIARFLVDYYGVMRAFFILGISFAIVLPILATPFKYPKIIGESNNSPGNTSNSSDIPLKEMIKTKSFRGVYLNFIIGTMIGLMMIGMTTNVGVDLFGLEPSNVPSFMTIFAIFNGLGRPTFGWLTDKISSKKAILLSYALITTAAILLITLGNNHIIVYIVSFSLFWFNLGGCLAIAPASTLRLYGTKYYSQNFGLVFTAYGIGAIVGVSTSGLLLDFLGNYRFVFYYVIALCFIGIIITNRYIKK